MRRAGKNWQDVKNALGLTRAGIKKWRDGNFSGVSAINVFALADFLNCDPRWLATGEKSDNHLGAFGQVKAVWETINSEGKLELIRHAEYVASQARYASDLPPAANG